MAKAPRKGAKAAKGAKSNTGGKSFKALNNLRARTLSLGDSSSLSEDEDNSEEHHGKKLPRKNYGADGSESESSLTALSDNDSDSKADSVFFESDDDALPRGKGKSIPGKAFLSKKKYSSTGKSVPGDDSDSDSSSSSESNSDSDVDFVKLQAQRKAMKSRNKGKSIKTQPEKPRRRRSSATPKFGRRKSHAALPDDIEFALEFEDDGDDAPVAPAATGEEDLGEEVEKSYTLPSDDDYEIDDNELLATLQADNDLEEFNDNGASARNDSVVLWGDDEDNDPFLKEEERFLVNEFENNGFDDEGTLNLQNYESYDADTNQTHLNDSLEHMNRNRANSDSYEEDDDEEDEDDYVVFDLLFDHKIAASDRNKIHSSARKRKHKKVGLSARSSDDEDDSYLWNYFFSLDESSNEDKKTVEDEGNDSESDNELLVDDFFEQTRRKPVEAAVSDHEYDSGESTDEDVLLAVKLHKKHAGSKLAKEVLSSKTADYRPPILGTWIAIDSKPFGIIDGLSTRNLVPPSRQMQPRKLRMDSASSSDDLALELDELLNISELDDVDETDIQIWRDFNNEKRAVPLGAFRNKFLFHPHSAAVPAGNGDGALNHTSSSNNDDNKRRYSLTNHSSSERRPSATGHKRPRRRSSSSSRAGLHIPSRAVRRRASNAQAESEGLRATKSGLFSETALANVEELLGDDTEILTLVNGI